MALAQKIMDRLLDLSTQLYTYDPELGLSAAAAGAGSNTGASNGTSRTNSALDNAGI